MTSKIKVDNIENQCGGAVVTKCGATTTISGSVVKADDIQAADGGNLINQCGTTITLGASGDTISLAAGASQSGFGRTGTVDWQTGSIKTATFTAANGEGYFANTSGGAFTMNLPAGSAGAIVSIQDYNNTFDTNALTVLPNGSDKINGGVAGSSIGLSAEGQGVTFVYIDSTVGWRSVQENEFITAGEAYVSATGGTITTSGNFKIHTFTGPGTFCVSSLATSPSNNIVDYVVVAGGGGTGSRWHAGGGGAGGYRESPGTSTCYTASPLGASPAAAIPVSVQGYPVTIGAGGAGGPAPGNNAAPENGSNSVFSTITSAGGGAGGTFNTDGINGGSGGAGGSDNRVGGSGNTPPVSPPQGRDGGDGVPGPASPSSGGGGGGGAICAGANSVGNQAGNGGNGATSCITGSPVARAGGGAGGTPGGGPNYGTGGSGGGGNSGFNGTDNTGGGGGGPVSPCVSGGVGGSGIVIIRYKFQ